MTDLELINTLKTASLDNHGNPPLSLLLSLASERITYLSNQVTDLTTLDSDREYNPN